jgi:hypothetical protein
MQTLATQLSPMSGQQSAVLAHVSPALRQRSGGGGAHTGAPPPAGGRQSPPQHSDPTEQPSPSSRQGRGAQNALMFAERGSCPGSQYATSLGSSPAAAPTRTAVTQICWRRLSALTELPMAGFP